MTTLHLLFNHSLTSEQEQEARGRFGVDQINPPPAEILRLWRALPPGADTLRPILEPVFSWLAAAVRPSDLILVQGEPGACLLVVEEARHQGIIPIYATTSRRAKEQRFDDGFIRLTHMVQHVRFREYGK